MASVSAPSASTSGIHQVSPEVQIAYTIYHAQTNSQPQPTPKPTIIFVNGLADPKESWAAQIPALTSAGYAVLTYDNRGLGGSSRPSGPSEVYTTMLMASDLASLLTNKNLNITGAVHILGVSMGGMIAQSFTLEHVLPQRLPAAINVLSITFACTYAFPGPFCTRMFEFWRDVATNMSVGTVLRDTLLWCFSPEYWGDAARQGEIKALDDDLKTVDDIDAGGMGLNAYLAQLNAILVFDSRVEIGKLAALKSQGGPKIVVLAGEDDILIPVSLSRELCGLIPGATWRTTRGGHACNWEFPDEFNQTCLEMWKEIEDGR
ncbi:hypothetical protein LTR84_003327 [Exophiala bonariae]|uniref:AB hydrolase-1 domain-containing protein n=1 Tax=Exophiala bonariae TaxID=1690606 RepID=A0AAV9N6S7_9EURO|nr:hypothetical protein LTR84_003327 [Exophiala bonariae]